MGVSGAGGSVLGRGSPQCKGPGAEAKLGCSRRAGRPARLLLNEQGGEWEEMRPERQCRS